MEINITDEEKKVYLILRGWYPSHDGLSFPFTRPLNGLIFTIQEAWNRQMYMDERKNVR